MVDLSRLVAFDQPMDRRLVHRSSTTEVFPTSFAQIGSSRHIVGLQWPRRHSFYETRRLDSAVVVETIRQLTILSCHKGLGVPPDSKFLMTGMTFDIPLPVDPLIQRSQAVELIADCEVNAPNWSGNSLRSVVISARILTQAGILLATGSGHARICSPAAYARLRSSSMPECVGQPRVDVPVDHNSVGRRMAADVVIAESAEHGSHVLVSDLHNPFFFDHAHDHVPGVVLIEAVRQHIAREQHDPFVDFSAFRADFSRVVEYAPVATVRGPEAEAGTFIIEQGGRTCGVVSASVREGALSTAMAVASREFREVVDNAS